MKTILTGIKPTGEIHIGNYVGAIKPGLQIVNSEDVRSLFFVADYHALTTVHDPKKLNAMIYDVAATWIAFGLNPKKSIIYRQSSVPEILEITWILSCFSPKGLMNRAHAYKAILQEGEAKGEKDLDSKVNMGIYTYPILMASDILTFDSDLVPVGEDQVQHIEIARDIAQKINHTYKKEILKIPKAFVKKETAILEGLDGRKMSKSYGNTIPAFCDSSALKKLIMKIKTDSLPPEAPKQTEGSLIYTYYTYFAKSEQVAELAEKYKKGIGWGEAKQLLYEALDAYLKEPREKYKTLMSDKKYLDQILEEGAEKARVIAKQTLNRIRSAIGIDS